MGVDSSHGGGVILNTFAFVYPMTNHTQLIFTKSYTF